MRPDGTQNPPGQATIRGAAMSVRELVTTDRLPALRTLAVRTGAVQIEQHDEALIALFLAAKAKRSSRTATPTAASWRGSAGSCPSRSAKSGSATCRPISTGAEPMAHANRFRRDTSSQSCGASSASPTA